MQLVPHLFFGQRGDAVQRYRASAPMRYAALIKRA